MNPNAPSRIRSPAERGSAWLLAAFAMLLGLVITAALVKARLDSVELEARTRFQHHGDRLQADIARRFNQAVYGLKGARGVFTANRNRVDRAAFRAYVESRDLPLEFPGVRGFGYAQQVQREDFDAFLAAERADAAPEFAIRTSGQAQDLFVIKYIEPLSANFQAWGYDLGAEPVRREAIERAIDSGQPTLSGRIALLQDRQHGPGFLYLVPVFRDGADPITPAQRRAAMLGLLYSPIVAAEVLRDVAAQEDGALSFRLVVAIAGGSRGLAFDSGQAVAAEAPYTLRAIDAGGRALSETRELAIGGRDFLLELQSTPAFERSIDRSSPWWLGAGGALISAMLACTLWMLAAGRARALALAEAMTVDLDRLAKVAERTSNAVVITDLQRRITWVNEGFTRITGYTAAEAMGRSPGELLQTERSDAGAIQAMRQALDAGRGCQVEVCNRSKDGRDYWLDIEIQPVRDAQGRTTGFMAIESDITARKDAETALAQERNRLADILESQTEMISRFTAAGVVGFVNDAYCREFGVRAEDIVGQSWAPVVLPEDLQRVRDELASLSPARPTLMIENRVLAAGGVVRWVQFTNRGFFDAAGQLLEVQSVGRDITERKRLEAQVAEAGASLQDLYDHAPCGYYSLDTAGRFTGINEQALRWLGCTRDEVLGGLGARDFCDAEGQLQFDRNFAHLKAGGRFDGQECNLLGRDGSRRRVSVSATAVTDENGAFLRSRSVMFDITETHQIRQRLHQMNLEQEAMLDNELVGIVKLRDRRGVWKNRALERLFGYGPDELKDQPARLLYPDDAAYEALGAAAYPVLAQGRPYRTQLQMRRKDGSLIWIDLSGVVLPGLAGEAPASLWMMVDISEIKRYQAQAERAALHDALTGLPNRVLLADRLRQALGLASRAGREVAVCYLDLDGFKQINDQHGHDAGDTVLCEVARRLLAGVRPSDTVARLGGDEFVVALATVDGRDDALAVLQRLLDEIVRPIPLASGARVEVGSSLGVALYPADGSTVEDLLTRADRAMFESKRAGRCGIRFHGDAAATGDAAGTAAIAALTA